MIGVTAFALAGGTAAAQKKNRARPAPAPAVEQKVKVAEGRYQLVGGQVVRGFEEPWTLYRTRLGYQLDEQWIVPQEGRDPAVIDVTVQLVVGFRPTELQIGGDPAQALICRFAVRQLTCEARGQSNKLDMDGPYDYFSPSPWMLGNIVRRVKKIPNAKTAVQLARIDGTNENGVELSTFPAEVQYVGEDQLDLSGSKYQASIYELKAEGRIPGMLVWISQEGIVLAIQDSTRPEQRLELSNLKVYGKL